MSSMVDNAGESMMSEEDFYEAFEEPDDVPNTYTAGKFMGTDRQRTLSRVDEESGNNSQYSNTHSPGKKPLSSVDETSEDDVDRSVIKQQNEFQDYSDIASKAKSIRDRPTQRPQDNRRDLSPLIPQKAASSRTVSKSS